MVRTSERFSILFSRLTKQLEPSLLVEFCIGHFAHLRIAIPILPLTARRETFYGIGGCDAKLSEDVAYWHNPDMPTPLLNVRYRARSGKHRLAASISAFDPDCDIEPGAIIWNVQSDWQRDDAVETRGSAREKAVGTPQMRSRVPFALRTVQSFFCRPEKESSMG